MPPTTAFGPMLEILHQRDDQGYVERRYSGRDPSALAGLRPVFESPVGRVVLSAETTISALSTIVRKLAS